MRRSLPLLAVLLLCGCPTEDPVPEPPNTDPVWPAMTEGVLRAGAADGTLDLPVGVPLGGFTGRDRALGSEPGPDTRDSDYRTDFVPSGGWQTRIPMQTIWIENGQETAVLVRVALVYSYGKSSVGDMDAIASMQLDPYYQSPLGIGPADLAAMQRQALLDAGAFPELTTDRAPGRDGAAATVLVADGTRYAKGPRIVHLEHRTDAMDVGRRGLLRARSAQLAGQGMGQVDAAFVHAPFGYQAPLLARELGLSTVTSSEAEIPMVTGLANLNRAARAGVRALGHCTSGPCLQQNLVCVVEPYGEGG